MIAAEYERAVLTIALIARPDQVAPLARLRADHFDAPFHRTLWTICREAHAAGRQVDFAEIKTRLHEKGVADETFLRVMDARPDWGNVETYVDAVLQAARERRVLAATELYGQAYRAQPHQFRRHLTDLKQELIAAEENRHVESTEVVVERALKQINADADRAAGGRTAGITTGYPQLDRYTGGWREGLIFVISWSSGGKTAFELRSVLAAGDAGYRFRFYSLDMNAAGVLLRLAAQRHSFDGHAVSSGELNGEQREQVAETAAWLVQHGTICEESLSIDDLVDDAMAYRDTYDVVFIDTLQSIRIDATEKKAGPYDRMCYTLNRLKELKKRTAKPIIIAAQAKDPPDRREAAKGDVAPPTLNDAEGARRITQEAHQMVIVWRHNYPESGPAPATIQLAKCQKGLTGRIACRWDHRFGRFEEACSERFGGSNGRYDE